MRFVIPLTVGSIVAAAAWFAEERWDTTRHRLNGAAYTIPHRYELTRQLRLPWLNRIPSFRREPEGAVMLLPPAAEIAAGVPGYSRRVRGYVGPVEAGITTEVTGDADRSLFAALHA